MPDKANELEPAATPITPLSALLAHVESGKADAGINQRYYELLTGVAQAPLTAGNIQHFALAGIGFCGVYNTELSNPTSSRIAFDTDLIHIQFRRRGRYLAGDSSSDARLIQGAELLISATRAGVTSSARAEAGDELQMLVIHLRPETLLQQLKVNLYALPEPLMRFIQGRGPQVAHEHVELHYVLPDRVARVLDGLLDSDMPEALGPRYRRLKAEECLVESLALLQTPEALAEREGFVGKATRPFEDAHRIIREHFRNPPNIDEIARAVGVSRRKLTAGFKTQYGMSLMAYALQLRMEEAQRLLRSGDFQVAQVGYRVGYRQPANFTQAYKAYFGYSPKAER